MTARDAAPELGAHAPPPNTEFVGAGRLRLISLAFDSNDCPVFAVPDFGQTTMPMEQLGKHSWSGD